MSENKMTHLKSLSSGRVFLRTDLLAARGDMIACDAQGNIAQGHIGDVANAQASERRKTKYLGNVTNGVLYPYTDILAEREDMVSIDTPEQWESMKENGDAPPVAADTIEPKLEEDAPALKRTGAVGSTTTADDQLKDIVSHETDLKPTGLNLPDIEGLNARDSKTALAEWAREKFNHKLDRRPALGVVLEECQGLIDGTVEVKAG